MTCLNCHHSSMWHDALGRCHYENHKTHEECGCPYLETEPFEEREPMRR